MASPGDADWRARELRRRVGNRLRAAHDRDRLDAAVAAASVGQDEPLAPLQVPSAGRSSQQVVSPLDRVRGHTVSLPELASAKHEAHDIRMEILDVETRHNATLQSCGKQFTAESAVRLLASDITAAQLQVRQKHGLLDDLHQRVLRLSRALHDESPEKAFAKTRIRSDEDIRKQQLGAARCPTCGSHFLPELMQQHADNCVAIGLPTIERSNQQGDSARRQTDSVLSSSTTSSSVVLPSIQRGALPRFVSQPPRSLRVMEHGVDHHSIVLAWDPPIFTGSNPIVDYELRASVYRSNDEGLKTVERIVPLLTSRWCLQTPVAPNQFRVGGLEADQEYGEFSLSAITINGKSASSNIVKLVKTAPSIEPTKPLFLSAGAITANSVALSWLEPHDNGGKPIVDYEIAFVEAVIEDKVATRYEGESLNMADVVYRPRRMRTYSGLTTFTIKNLLSGREHKQFQVRAVNSDGKPGDYSNVIESIFTIAPGSEFKLLDELQAAVNSRSRVIDSPFLSGFMQRYERQYYISLVSKCIVDAHPHLEAKVKAILQGSSEPQIEEDDAVEDEEDDAPPVSVRKFDDMTEDEKIAERRRQFHFRIADLQSELKKAEYNVQWCVDRRIDLVALIRAAETRILEKQAELERARMFRGPQMDSDVFENGRQRFYTKELIIALEDEIEIDQLYIVDAKAEMIKVENYLRADEKRRSTVVRRIEERRLALADFERNPSANSSANHGGAVATLARLQHGLLHRSFLTLAKNRQDNIDQRAMVKRALLRVKQYNLRKALQKWLAVVNASDGPKIGSTDDLIGIGSVNLLSAALNRDDLLLETQSLLKQVRGIDDKLDDVRWMRDQQRQVSNSTNTSSNDVSRPKSQLEFDKCASVLVEADSRMALQDYESAHRLYQGVYGNAQWVDMMSPQQLAKLLLNIGESTFSLKQFEHALTHFRRASLLASRFGLRFEHGQADLRLGAAFYEMRSLKASVECYERALLSFEALGDKQAELECYRGLQHSYSKLGDKEMEGTNRSLADEIEFALANTLTSANQHLDRLQQRIVGAGAESSCEITLERVGAIVPRLRKERIGRQLVVREELKFVEGMATLLAEKRKLLAQGEEDLKRALASDSTEVDSCVIIGANARYEIENFKQKLAKLMGVVRAGEEHITKEIANSKIRVSNADDEIKELEQELVVETGALMQRMMSKEKLRCFSFNAANERLKNVVGTASGGFPMCAATAGMTGLLFDLLTGACLAQALGDPRKEHLGDPTGHQAPIISLCYVGRRVYTGSMEASLGVWDVKDELVGGYSVSLTKMLYEFDAAVVSVAADKDWTVCGCSDCDVFVFDAHSFALIARMIGAHTQTVTALSVNSSRAIVTTGAADKRVKVWEFGPISTTAARRRAKLAFTLEAEREGDTYFNGHLHSITCVMQEANEIVSGDAGGRVIVWSLDADNKLLRMCDVQRDTAVTCLQFDATRIVVGLSSGDLCVIDFATGNLLQTLHGHQADILDLQFDQKRLVSMSSDGKLRLWYWLTQLGSSGRNKYHILGAGETLRSLSLKYRTSIQKLLRWNGLPDSSNMYLGQKLIVEVDTGGNASDELQTLDRASSVVFGKLSFEDLDFVTANKAKAADVEGQWAAQRMAMLAKEYFPPLDDDVKVETESKGGGGSDEAEKKKESEQVESDSDVPDESGDEAGSDGGDEGEGEND